jgi:diguanylate cyclase (GGDEF)-like protein/PAS domain S-box-containing protein
MRKLAVEEKLKVYLTAILLSTAMLGVLSYCELARINNTFEFEVNSATQKLQLTAEINTATDEMLAAQRAILLYAHTPEGDENERTFEMRSAQVDGDTNALVRLSADREELRTIARVKGSNASYRKAVEQIGQQHVSDLMNGRNLANAYKSIDETTDELQALESNHLQEALGETRTRLKYGRLGLGGLAAIAVFVVIFALGLVEQIGEAMRGSEEEARASAELASGEAAFSEMLIDSMPCAIHVFDAEGNVKRWNKNFLGYSHEDTVEHGALATMAPERPNPVKQAMAKTFEEGHAELEGNMIRKDGVKFAAYITLTRFMYAGEPCILGVAFDTSKQKMAEQDARLQRVALESASEAIVITDQTGSIEWANPAFTTLTGYEVERVLGMNMRILKSGMMDSDFYRKLWSTIQKGEKWSGELWNLNKDGDLYSEEMHIAPVRSTDGSISNFVAVKHDITRRKQLEAQAEHAKQGLVSMNKELREANEHILRIAQTDCLTGLANRRTADERMLEETARAERLGCGFSVILADLDHFKSINDEFGHLIGDKVLKATASVLAEQARTYDLPARFGGEEFLVLLPESTLGDAMTIAQRIRTAVAAISVPGVARQITVSVGISTWALGDTPGELVSRADVALYQAKRRGRNRVVAQTTALEADAGHGIIQADTPDTLVYVI